MPYEGEFAGYRPLNRIAQAERVKQLLSRAVVSVPQDAIVTLAVNAAPVVNEGLPELAVAIDGSYSEVPVANGYPGAHVGYVTVASVLLKLSDLERLDEDRPIDPVEFRKTEQAATVDAALPGSNVLTRDHRSAKDSFREALFDVLHDEQIDADDSAVLLDTFQYLLRFKPTSSPQQCPIEGCERSFVVEGKIVDCPCQARRRIYPTDALRVHERFSDYGANGEVFGLVMQVWERLLLVHFLRCFEQRRLFEPLSRLVFFVDGPLAVFGPPAWMSAAISRELKRLNGLVREQCGKDLLIVGVEKSGAFVEHFNTVDEPNHEGSQRFGPRTYSLLTDSYIKERIAPSDSSRRYGQDTYFGRKFFYKTASGARIVASLPFLSDERDSIVTDDIGPYREFGTVCAVLDQLVSSRYSNALSPIVSAHSHAAIPLHLGSKVLQQLAQALMRKSV
jgi:hypothetical protein